MKGFLARFCGTESKVPPASVVAATTTATSDFADAWQKFLGFGVDRDDLLQILEESPFEPRLREYAGRTLLDRHQADQRNFAQELIELHEDPPL